MHLTPLPDIVHYRMQSAAALPPAIPVVPFLGVVVQLGGVALLVGLFLLLRRFVLRRGYFTSWTWAWVASTLATGALLVRYLALPPVIGVADEAHPAVRMLYFVFQASEALGIIFFVRGTLMYVSGGRAGPLGRTGAYIAGILFSAFTAVVAANGLNEMIMWQSLVAVPAFGYCAAVLFWLPPSRRSLGSRVTGILFALLGGLWLIDAGAFGVVVRGGTGGWAEAANAYVEINAYLAMALHVALGYAMVVLLMEDAKREVDDAQAELRVSHDQMRRAALYDTLTESLNRRAFAEGVGLEMVRATYGTAVIADMDNLKLVNDQYGHMVGDILLRRCADVLRGALRPYDKLYRWGGDEFLLIMPSARAMDVLARLEAVLAESQPLRALGAREAVRLEVSLGAANYASAEELGTAIERADRAMYQEKTRRKGTAMRNTPQSVTVVPPGPGRSSVSVEAVG